MDTDVSSRTTLIGQLLSIGVIFLPAVGVLDRALALFINSPNAPAMAIALQEPVRALAADGAIVALMGCLFLLLSYNLFVKDANKRQAFRAERRAERNSWPSWRRRLMNVVRFVLLPILLVVILLTEPNALVVLPTAGLVAFVGIRLESRVMADSKLNLGKTWPLLVVIFGAGLVVSPLMGSIPANSVAVYSIQAPGQQAMTNERLMTLGRADGFTYLRSCSGKLKIFAVPTSSIVKIEFVQLRSPQPANLWGVVFHGRRLQIGGTTDC